MSGDNHNANVVSEKDKNIQKIASAIEDLLYMEAIKVNDEGFDKAILSSKFAVIVSNLVSSMKLNHDNSHELDVFITFNLYERMPQTSQSLDNVIWK